MSEVDTEGTSQSPPAAPETRFGPDTRLVSGFRHYSAVASGLAVLAGSGVLIGWWLDIGVLKSVLPGLVTMKANTAAAFLLAGAALWCLRPEVGERGAERWDRRLGQACAGTVALLGLLTLSQGLGGWDLGIDQILFAEPMGAVGTAMPGRMSPVTALNFILLGSALLVLDVPPRGLRAAQVLVLITAFTSLVTFVGYLYGVSLLYRIAPHTTAMAVHTSLAFLLLSAGVLCARPQRGVVGVIASQSSGGALARRLLPAAVVVPVLFGWLRWEGERAGLYGTSFGIALFTTAMVLALTVLVWSNARWVERVDEQRQQAQAKLLRARDELKELNQFLEEKVDQRTAALRAEIAERQRVESEFRARARQQAVVADLGQEALAGTELPTLMHQAVARVAQTLEVEYCKVLELLPDGQALLLRAGVGWKDGLVGQASVGAGRDSQAGYTLLSSDPVVVEDLRTESRFSGPPLLRDHGVVSGLSVIIHGQERPFGVLGAHTTRLRRFTPDDVHFLQAVANVLAAAIGRQRAEELDRFFSLSLDMLCIADFDGYFKRLNPAWEKTLGFSHQELLASPYLDFVHPEDREATRAEAEKLNQGADVVSFENRYRCQDGSYRWLLWKATPLPTKQLIYAAARDISERREALARLRQVNVELAAANQELEAFTYSVSHDLRAPLRHIDGFSRILVEDFGPRLEPQAGRYLQRIQDGARQMGQLVDSLLNLSRLGRQELRPQMTGLSSLVDSVRAELEPDVGDRRVNWKIGPLPFVECDPALMRQVFRNLLANALKFTRQRTPALIQVGHIEADGRPVIFVRDNGAGFSMKYADKLFGVFQRLHRQEDFEGTGVGLATVQRILHKHGGRIWAEAELDKGATFYFTLGGVETNGSDNQTLTTVRGALWQ